MVRPTRPWFGPPDGTGWLPKDVRRALAAQGGIISTSELRRLYVWQSLLELHRSYGSLQALRQGWYCAPELPEVIRLAWRFGGPLACVSAIAFHDAMDAINDRDGKDGRDGRHGKDGKDGRDGSEGSAVLDAINSIEQPLHVCVSSGTARVPSPELLARRWNIPIAPEPIIHWSTHDTRSGDRRAVSRDVAVRQAARCESGLRAMPGLGFRALLQGIGEQGDERLNLHGSLGHHQFV